MKRKKNKENKEIANFAALYDKAVGEQSLISPFISGHLVLEFLLRKLIQIHDPLLKNLSESLSFTQIVKLNYELRIIKKLQRDVLLKINSIRNKFVHEITYELPVSELKGLLKTVLKAFSDFTDGISQGLEELEKLKTTKLITELDCYNWVISGLFIQISYDLHLEYQSRSGNDDNTKDFYLFSYH